MVGSVVPFSVVRISILACLVVCQLKVWGIGSKDPLLVVMKLPYVTVWRNSALLKPLDSKS